METRNNPLEGDPRLKADIHRVPEGYFENLPLQVQRHVTTHPGLTAKPWRLLALRYAMPYATAICLLVVGGYVFFGSASKKQEARPLVATETLNLTREEALEYLHQNVEHLDEAVLAENLAGALPAAKATDSLPAVRN